MNKYFKPTLLAIGLALAAGPAAALDVYLAAKPFTKTLPMSGGTTVDVPMWGYVVDADVTDATGTGPANGIGDCYEAADKVACVAGLPDPAVPGPRITVDPADTALDIFLTNGLLEPTSIIIPGQSLPISIGSGPTWDDDSIGSRGADLAKKVRSFGSEALASGGTESYSWILNRPGTFVYHSGTHPQKQVYMGLYGAVTMDAVAAVEGVSPAVAYNDPETGLPLAATSYDNEVVLFYSDIDPVINNAIAGATYTTSVDYNAQWFLVNGEPYDPANKLDPAMSIPAGNAKERTLVRFLSAASETHVPTLQGLYMTILAEDGLVYNYQDATGAHAAPRTQYSVKLPPLKTKDAIISPQLEGTYAVYDGNGYMTNPSDINDFTVGDTVGGMLRFLAVGPDGNDAPIAGPDTATAVEGRTITINVLANDSDPEGQPLTIAAFSAAATGTVTCDTLNPGGACDYTAVVGGILPYDDTFTYDVTDGVSTTAGVVVTVTVVANEAPVAVDDTATTDANTPVVVNVLSNDTDANGDTLSIASFDATSAQGATVSCDTLTGDCTYTPDGIFIGNDTFTYVATDGSLNSASATVTVAVTPGAVNTPPVAVDDTYSVGEDTVLNVAAPGVLDNDTDAESDPLTVSQVNGLTINVGVATATTSGGTVTVNANGSLRYVPALNYFGPDSFTYVANDGTDDGNTATVTIDVTPVNDPPVAVNDTFYLNSMVTTTVPDRGVLINDTDVDNDPATLTAVLDAFNNQPPAFLDLGPNGGFAYTADPGNVGVGTLDTFTYFANDGEFDSTLPGAVALIRKLSVTQAVCERRPNGNCDWRIQGQKLDAAPARVQAFITGTATLIGQTPPNTGAGAWAILVNNSAVNLGLAPIDVKVLGDANATILNYPVTEQ